MAGVALQPDTPETRKALQDAARHGFILKMYQEIMFDMKVCEIEGWDKMEFIDMIFDILNSFKKKRKKALSLFKRRRPGMTEQLSMFEEDVV